MKYFVYIFTFTCINYTAFSQIKYEKGYYINNSADKMEGYIKNIDWLNNPTNFLFKSSENSISQNLDIASVKEFGVYNRLKYVREKVQIDRSSESHFLMSSEKNPIFKDEVLFLKVMLEGNATLYSYTDGNLHRFFFKTTDSQIDQLVYKTYKIRKTLISKNNYYKQQLLTNLPCEKITTTLVEKVDYNKNDLVEIFTDYNNCGASKNVSIDSKENRDLFNISIRPGARLSTLQFVNSTAGILVKDFDKEIRFSLGVESEFIFPFNKNKISALIEPTYQYFTSETISNNQKASVDYKSLELAAGVRYYIFLSEQSKIFANFQFIFDFTGNSKILLADRPDLEIESKNNLIFGIGYKWRDRLSLELRTYTKREILSRYQAWRSGYDSNALILGYTLF